MWTGVSSGAILRCALALEAIGLLGDRLRPQHRQPGPTSSKCRVDRAKPAIASSPSLATFVTAAVLLLLAVACGLAPAGAKGSATDEVFRDRRLKMGTHFEIQIRGPDESVARQAMEAAFREIDRVEQRLSEWQETSDISMVNRQAGHDPVRVGDDLLAVIARSAEVAEITEGAFDITFAACGRLWSFREPTRIASRAELAACRQLVGWRRIQTDPARSTVRLPVPGMRIGISAVGKGYGVDRAAAVLESWGISDYLVDGGGDIRASLLPGHRPWRVGIAHPRRPGQIWGSVETGSGAIVTSGDYEAFFVVDGVRYHHILDPRTGRPCLGASSVTVIAPDATTADALATGLMVLGPERGMKLVESLAQVEALFLVDDREHSRSSGFPPVQPDGASS